MKLLDRIFKGFFQSKPHPDIQTIEKATRQIEEAGDRISKSKDPFGSMVSDMKKPKRKKVEARK